MTSSNGGFSKQQQAWGVGWGTSKVRPPWNSQYTISSFPFSHSQNADSSLLPVPGSILFFAVFNLPISNKQPTINPLNNPPRWFLSPGGVLLVLGKPQKESPFSLRPVSLSRFQVSFNDFAVFPCSRVWSISGLFIPLPSPTYSASRTALPSVLFSTLPH